MRYWYVISGQNEYTQCEFVSVNLLKRTMWLKVNGKLFKVEFDTARDHNYAKRGEEIRCNAMTKSISRRIKIVFK